KPLRKTTAFRITLNTLKDPKLVAFSIAIGGKKGQPHPFPFGANVSAPAKLFLTVHPGKGKSGLVTDLRRATNGKRVRGKFHDPRLNMRRRQIEVRIPHRAWNPRRKTVRLAAGVGLWDGANKRYLLPQASADESHPGGAGGASKPGAFFNVAFRTHEPMESPTEGLAVVTNPA